MIHGVYLNYAFQKMTIIILKLTFFLFLMIIIFFIFYFLNLAGVRALDIGHNVYMFIHSKFKNYFEFSDDIFYVQWYTW